jgi:hypothetical protein
MENAVNALRITNKQANFLRVFSVKNPKQNMTAVLRH